MKSGCEKTFQKTSLTLTLHYDTMRIEERVGGTSRGGDVLYTFFFICFGVGVAFTVLSFLFGEVFHFMGFDSQADSLDIETDMSVDTNYFDFGTGVSILKPSVIATFITVFGGSGILLLEPFGAFFSLFIALAIGMFVAGLLFRLVIVPMNRAQNTSAVEVQALIGHPAKITVSIPQGGYGKITYSVNGNTYSSPAKTESGEALLKGTVVEIVFIEKNTYFVRER